MDALNWQNYHSKECVLRMENMAEVQKQWLDKWPNYCTRCGGWGGFWSQYDPSPAGVSLSPGSMVDFDPCGCSEQARCPRCGSSNTIDYEDDDQPCSVCGWNWGKGDDDGMPPDPECVCLGKESYENSDC